MKKTYFIIFLCCGVSLFACKTSNPLDDNPDDKDTTNTENTVLNSDYLFDIEKVAEVRLDVSEQEWNRFLHNFDLNMSNEECILARFTYKKGNDVFTLDSVGLRLRGNTSRRRPEGTFGENHNAQNPDWHHAHFVIKFQEYKKEQLFCENDRLTLKWFKDDAAYCREVYCYDLFRRFGVYTAPRVAYTRLIINVAGDSNPAYFGAYVLLEGVNDSYLENRKKTGKFLSANGNLWKANWGANLSPSSMENKNFGVEKIDLNPDNSQYFVYDLKTNKKQLETARTQLQNFVNNMNPLPSGSQELKEYLLQNVDIDIFLRAYAVNVMVGMWDDYWINTNNFYFYFDQNGKFLFIPFDYDNTLGTSYIIENSGAQNPMQWGDLGSDRVLMRKIMSIPEFKAQYRNYLLELAENPEYFKPESSIARITRWQSMISPYVSNDTNEDMNIIDKPADWGNCPFYRLLSGNDNTNFFKAKVKSLE
ncbi:MAG: CotH kinase family protein [Prevotellaceae bacterium]|nr:CotH kinase family protein [Prevotellaceae bacterium]